MALLKENSRSAAKLWIQYCQRSISPDMVKLLEPSGRHTSLTDLALTENGKSNARRFGNALRGPIFVKVFTSPLQRPLNTCKLAGFGAQAEVDQDLVEWNYGEYKGCELTKSMPSVQDGTCFGMDVLRANQLRTWD